MIKRLLLVASTNKRLEKLVSTSRLTRGLVSRFVAGTTLAGGDHRHPRAAGRGDRRQPRPARRDRRRPGGVRVRGQGLHRRRPGHRGELAGRHGVGQALPARHRPGPRGLRRSPERAAAGGGRRGRAGRGRHGAQLGRPGDTRGVPRSAARAPRHPRRDPGRDAPHTERPGVVHRRQAADPAGQGRVPGADREGAAGAAGDHRPVPLPRRLGAGEPAGPGVRHARRRVHRPRQELGRPARRRSSRLRVPDAARRAPRRPAPARRRGLPDPHLPALRHAVVPVPDAPHGRAARRTSCCSCAPWSAAERRPSSLSISQGRHEPAIRVRRRQPPHHRTGQRARPRLPPRLARGRRPARRARPRPRRGPRARAT